MRSLPGVHAADVDVDGVRVRYREAGRGPTVVLVAGLGLSGRFYEHSFLPFAAAGLRLVVPDLPGCGGTRGPFGGLDVATTAAFLQRFTATLDITRAGFIGHSLGWQSAALLAVVQPDLVAALIATAPTVPRGRRRALRQLARFGIAALRADRKVLQGIARDYVRTTPAHYIGTWLRHAHDDPLANLARTRCPVLVLIGDRDPMARPADITMLLRCAPRAVVTCVPAGTHGLPRQDPEAFNHETTRFFRDVLRP